MTMRKLYTPLSQLCRVPPSYDRIFSCRFLAILDQIDSKVEKLRKEALMLQDKKDFLAMSMDLLRNNEYLTGLKERKYPNVHNKVSFRWVAPPPTLEKRATKI